jgi:hypothetical protein
MKRWSFDFADDQGISGALRLTVADDRHSRPAASFHAQVVVPEVGVVVVRDDDVPAPRRDDVVVVRAEGLWAELLCETPGEHWSVGLEAFGVRFDSEAEAAASDRGERVPVGLDVEWETPDRVVGEVLVGRARYDLDGHGTFTAPPPPTGVTKAQ